MFAMSGFPSSAQDIFYYMQPSPYDSTPENVDKSELLANITLSVSSLTEILGRLDVIESDLTSKDVFTQEELHSKRNSLNFIESKLRSILVRPPETHHRRDPVPALPRDGRGVGQIGDMIDVIRALNSRLTALESMQPQRQCTMNQW